MAAQHGEGHGIETEPAAGCQRLALEPLADKRNSGHTGRFCCNGCPQHGGRATASTTVADEHSIDAMLRQLARQRTNEHRFIVTVNVAERFVGDHLEAGESLFQFRLDHGEEFLTPEQVVPDKPDALSGKRRKTWGKRFCLAAERGFGPHHFIRRLLHLGSPRLARLVGISLSEMMRQPDYLLRVSTTDADSFETLYIERLASLPHVQTFTSQLAMKVVKRAYHLPVAVTP